MPTRCNRLYLLQILLHAQHISGNTMPIIRSSRVLYRWSLPVVFGVAKTEKVICRLGRISVLALSVERCICCCRVRRESWGLCMSVLGSICGLEFGWFVLPKTLIHSPHDTRRTLQQHIQRSTLNAKTQILPNLQITFSVFAAPNTTGSDHLYNTLELLMMGIVLPEIC